jgi:hypothetical protein
MPKMTRTPAAVIWPANLVSASRSYLSSSAPTTTSRTAAAITPMTSNESKASRSAGSW